MEDEEQYAPEMEQQDTQYQEEIRPETREEMEYEIVAPSNEYRKAYDLLQKDMVLSKLNEKKQKFVQICASIDSELSYLENQENMDLKETKQWLLRQAMVKVETSRAIEGRTLEMLRTKIQKYKGEQTMTQKTGSKNMTDKLKERLPYRE